MSRKRNNQRRTSRPPQLVDNDIRIYCRMVTALWHTIAIQQELDIVYPDAENNLMLTSVSK